jgi:hypothetical protein
MDDQLLKIVGEIAGIGGVALGVFLLLFKELLKKIVAPAVTREQWYKVVVLFMVLAWSIAFCGIGAWALVGLRHGPNFALFKPLLRSPADLSEFDRYPRLLELVWEPVPDAVAYRVESEIQVEIEGEHRVEWAALNPIQTPTNHSQIQFGGATWGRWRVTAINNVGNETQKSDWWTFHFRH